MFQSVIQLSVCIITRNPVHLKFVYLYVRVRLLIFRRNQFHVWFDRTMATVRYRTSTRTVRNSCCESQSAECSTKGRAARRCKHNHNSAKPSRTTSYLAITDLTNRKLILHSIASTCNMGGEILARDAAALLVRALVPVAVPNEKP